MGVKLSDSLEDKAKRININTINYIYKNSKNSYLKFVVSEENFKTQIEEIKEILSKTDPSIQVFLMPKAKDMEELEKNCRFVIEKCIEYGFNYTDRSHIRAWNTKEGV